METEGVCDARVVHRVTTELIVSLGLLSLFLQALSTSHKELSVKPGSRAGWDGGIRFPEITEERRC